MGVTSDTPTYTAGGRTSICPVRQPLELSPAQVAVGQVAAVIGRDTRSELACDGFRCGGCCTLLLYQALDPWAQDFDPPLTWGGAMGIRTPDLLHAMNHSRVPRPGHMQLDQAKH